MLTPLIYIVSEESSSPENLQQRLTEQGLKVMRSGRRTEALRFFETVKPDLTIIDSRGKDSRRDLETVRLLHRQCRGTPVFLIVKESSETKAIDALRSGVDDYFKRPVSLEDLVDSIHRHLARAGGASPGDNRRPDRGDRTQLHR